MIIDNDVPFYANTADDTHCFQAALRMTLKYFLPDKKFSWHRLDEITAKQPDMWTWPMEGLCCLRDQDFNVLNIEDFDYKRFISEKEAYLYEKYGVEVAKESIKHSNIETEINWAKRFMAIVPSQSRIPSIEELVTFLEKDYLVIANVNARTLNNKPGYVGHFIVIKGVDDNRLTIHDPGLPAIKNRKVSNADFLKAWSYPNKNARNLIAIRPR